MGELIGVRRPRFMVGLIPERSNANIVENVLVKDVSSPANQLRLIEPARSPRRQPDPLPGRSGLRCTKRPVRMESF